MKAARNLSFFCICLLPAAVCFTDTFTHRETGETFDGYAIQKKRGSETVVRTSTKNRPEYINLANYDIEWNPSGRKNRVVILPIKNDIKYQCETEALEKAIEVASNQGPLFIIMEIDTPGGRMDLMKRICCAITQANNCRTAAFISGGKHGGAYSAGAVIALACDYIYMKNDTCIGAATPIVASASGVEDLASAYGETVGEKFMSAVRGYAAGLAERSSRRSLIARAMVDKKVEVYEVLDENGQTLFVEGKDKKPEHTVVRVWSKKGSLLTLTAAEAEQCGIADKMVTSRSELFTELNAVKAKQVYNKSALKARVTFEKVEDKFNKILLSIEILEKQIATLAKETAKLDEIISRTDRVTRYKGRRYIIKQRQYHPTALKELSNKGELCLKLLKDLEKEYEKALPIAQKHPDLNHHVSDIEKGLKYADATRQEVSTRLKREN